MKSTEYENLRVFVNANRNVTAIHRRLVYEIETGSLKDSFAIVETWLRGGGNVEFCTDQQRSAANAVRALILGNYRIGNLSEMQSNGSDKLKMFGGNPNPSGRAGSSQWAICR